MRLAPIVAAALAVAVLHIAPLPATAQDKDTLAPVCKYTMGKATQELTDAGDVFTLIEGKDRDDFLAQLKASYKLKTGQTLTLPPVTRVLLVVMQDELFFGLEFENGCLSPPMALAFFLPDTPRSGRDATGTHS